MEALSISNLRLLQPVRFPHHPQQRHNHCYQRCHYHSRGHHNLLPLHNPRMLSPISFSASPLSLFSSLSIKRGSSLSSSLNTNNPPNEETPKALNPSFPPPSRLSLLKLPLCVVVAAAALFISRFPFRPIPAFAEPAAATAESLSETAKEKDYDAISREGLREVEVEKKQERELEEHLASHPEDAEALKSLMEVKIKSRNLPEVIDIASRLIDLQPDEIEWRLLRGHMYCYMGEPESAKSDFESILEKEPNRVEAFHGLVMAASQLESGDGGKQLEEVERRIEGAMDRCNRDKLKDEVREFKLLMAQIRVIEGDYAAALKVYQELVKEEPRDYRPYLCQGIIYTLLRKKDEAEKQFEKYKRLVPKEHPYAKYFEENVRTTAKVFSQMAENERVKS